MNARIIRFFRIECVFKREFMYVRWLHTFLKCKVMFYVHLWWMINAFVCMYIFKNIATLLFTCNCRSYLITCCCISILLPKHMQKKRRKSFMYKRITKRLNLESNNMHILHYKFSLQAGLQSSYDYYNVSLENISNFTRSGQKHWGLITL